MEGNRRTLAHRRAVVVDASLTPSHYICLPTAISKHACFLIARSSCESRPMSCHIGDEKFFNGRLAIGDYRLEVGRSILKLNL